MQIKEMILGRKLESLVDREGYNYRLVSKVEGTTDSSVAVSAIVAKGRMFHFEETDDVTIIYRSEERMWKWEHVKPGLARFEGETVHTFSSKEPGQVYNRRESFRVPIGENLLMYRVEIEKIEEDGEVKEQEKRFPFEGLLSDLSVNGAGLYTDEELQTDMLIGFDMPTHLGVMSCRGKVVRRADVYDKPFRNFYGCEFVKVRRELERYLFERQRLMLQKQRGGEATRLK